MRFKSVAQCYIDKIHKNPFLRKYVNAIWPKYPWGVNAAGSWLVQGSWHANQAASQAT